MFSKISHVGLVPVTPNAPSTVMVTQPDMDGGRRRRRQVIQSEPVLKSLGRPQGALPSLLMFVALMIGHHFSISAF